MGVKGKKEKQDLMLQKKVSTATVVITNVGQHTVAIRYPLEGNEYYCAPIVVASGVNLNAQQIQEIAQQNNIPIAQSPALARALYYHAEVGDYIPRELFRAAADVLLMVDFFKKNNKEFTSLPDFYNVDVPWYMGRQLAVSKERYTTVFA